jgi:UDP-N-acetylglucosamine--N-acetylmuramyl-(pentapeptide) pyrophosphoryl-undecaprenol N-acetylglucosamine transferase
MRAILAGGGTGGHVIPALAIAEELRALAQAEVVFLGTPRGLENRLVPAAGYELRHVQVGALKNVSLATRARTALGLPRAIARSWSILGELRPGVVIGVGGYASGPAMLAAALRGLPTLIFEPNAVPGFANRLVAPMASVAAVHFEQTCRYFRRCVVTGVPVRREFFDVPPLGERAPERLTLLVFGGSQGAQAINRAVVEAARELTVRLPGLRILHQTGERDYNEAQAAYLQAGVAAEVFPFIEQMPQAFARADLLLCRAGASTVAEVAAAGRPAVFVPFPRAADDHQTRNAQALEQAGAAVLLSQGELSPARLADVVAGLLNDRALLAQMGRAARQMAHPGAARDIACLALRLAGERITS